MKVKIGDICKRFSSGKNIKACKIKNVGKYPVFGANGLRGYTDEYNFDGECAIIGRQGAYCGNVKYFSGKAYMTEHAIVAEADENNVSGYLYYKFKIMNLAQFQGQSAQPGLSVNTLSNIEIEVPEKRKQEEIFETLHRLEKKIQINEKINNELENIINHIYGFWFLQFDFPNEKGGLYKSSGGSLVWNEVLKQEIPEGWKVQNLKENDLTYILNPGIENFKGSKIYLATGDVENNDIVSGKNVTYENRESRANMQPMPNTVWFAKMKNSIKHIFVGEYSKSLIKDYIFSTGFLGLKCVDRRNLEYINCFINSEFFELQKDKLAHGATQEAVNNNDIKLIPLIIPDNEILEKFHEKTKDILQKIYLNNLENEELKNLRDFLLPLLMNGQVKL